jgi:hypothetical protein
MYVRTCYTVVLASVDPLRSDVTCHLVAVRETPMRESDKTDLPVVCIRHVPSTRTLSRRIKEVDVDGCTYVALGTE